MQPITIDAGPVRLRRHRESDAAALAEAARDPGADRWTRVPPGYARDGAAASIARWRGAWGRVNCGVQRFFPFAVADPGTDAYLGNLDLAVGEPRTGAVGYWLLPAARGRGLMAAALRALAGWAFAAPGRDGAEGLGLEALRWEAPAGNWAARRTAWAAGFRVEGLVRGLIEHRGGRVDGWIGSLRRGDPLLPAGRWLDVPELAGAGCVLRAPEERDARGMTDGRNDPVTQYFLPVDNAPVTVERSLAMLERQREQHALGTCVNWTIARRAADGGGFAGSLSLMEIDPAERSAEVGYWLHPSARGRGIAAEALRLAVGHAFAPRERGGLGLRRLSLEAAASNRASQALAERGGFTRVGVHRRAERLGDGGWDDLVVFDLLAGEAGAVAEEGSGR